MSMLQVHYLEGFVEEPRVEHAELVTQAPHNDVKQVEKQVVKSEVRAMGRSVGPPLAEVY